MRPGYVDFEEQQEDRKADNRWVERIRGGVEPVEEQVSVDLWLDKYEVDEEDHEVVLNILIGETFAAWTLHQPHVGSHSATSSAIPALCCSFILLGFRIFACLCIAATK